MSSPTTQRVNNTRTSASMPRRPPRSSPRHPAPFVAGRAMKSHCAETWPKHPRSSPADTELTLRALYSKAGAPKVDRDAIETKHFAGRIDSAGEKGIGMDFNPPLFAYAVAHQKAVCLDTRHAESSAVSRGLGRTRPACRSAARSLVVDGNPSLREASSVNPATSQAPNPSKNQQIQHKATFSLAPRRTPRLNHRRQS